VSDRQSINDPDEQRAIARIEQALSSLGSEHYAPEGWEARVLAASEAPSRRTWRQRWHRWRPWQRFLIPGLPALAAAAAVVMWAGPRAAPAPAGGRLMIAMASPQPTPAERAPERGGDQPRHFPADQELRFEAAGDEPHRALRIYKDDRLAFSCEDAPPNKDGCQVLADRLILRWRPSVQGKYTALLLSSDRPLPPTQESLDADLSATYTAKVRAERAPFEVH
jgi:hypothetical protein